MSSSADADFRDVPPAEVMTITADGVRGMSPWAELWRYRELAWVMLERDVRVRYRQTVMGVAWAVLQPLIMMVVFTVFFGRLAKIPSEGVPYPVFVYAGLLPWLFFSNAVSAASSALVNQAGMISKIYFPRLLLPASALGVYCLDLLLASLILFVLMLFYGVPFTAPMLFMPVLALGVALTAAAMGIAFSALIVSYRDFRFVVPFAMQIWMFLTPVIYPLGLVPEDWRWLMWLNPMAGFVDGFRAVLLDRPLQPAVLLVSCLVTLVLLTLAVRYFRRVERRFADVI